MRRGDENDGEASRENDEGGLGCVQPGPQGGSGSSEVVLRSIAEKTGRVDDTGPK